MMRKISLLLVVTVFLSACASGGKVVPRGQSHKSITLGSVLSSEEITIGGSNTGIGSYAGSIAAVADSTSDSLVGFIARSVVGGIVGSSAEEVITRKSGKLYRIETNRGDIIEVASTNKEINNGDCVEIQRSGHRYVAVQPSSSSGCIGKHATQTARI